MNSEFGAFIDLGTKANLSVRRPHSNCRIDRKWERYDPAHVGPERQLRAITGHVWTAPLVKGRFEAVVNVSGAVMSTACLTRKGCLRWP